MPSTIQLRMGALATLGPSWRLPPAPEADDTVDLADRMALLGSYPIDPAGAASGAAAFAGVGTLDVLGTSPAVLAFAGSGTFAASGTASYTGAAAFAATATLTTAGVASYTGAAAFAATGTLAVAAGLHYRIYASDGLGGPVDLTTPVATVAGLTWDTPALAAGSDTTYLVRAYDEGSGLEDRNTDARVRILVDAAQVDITTRPNPPINLSVVPAAGGSAVVSWRYNPGAQGGLPTEFRVYQGTPAVSYASAVATVNYVDALRLYTATLSGLTDGATYQIGVRSKNAAGVETNTTVVSVTADATGPDPVEGLAAEVIA